MLNVMLEMLSMLDRIRGSDGTIASRQCDIAAARTRTAIDDVEDSHIWARRLSPTDSHRRRMTEEARIPRNIRCKVARDYESLVNDVHTTVEDVEGQVIEVNPLVDMEVVALADIDVSATSDIEDTPRADTEIIMPTIGDTKIDAWKCLPICTWKPPNEFRNLQCTMSYGILYEIGKGGDLLGWHGSIYIGDHVDRKSTHDYDFKLGPTTISWSSNKQPIVRLNHRSKVCGSYIICLQMSFAEKNHNVNGIKAGFHQELHKQDSSKNCIVNYCDNSSNIKLSKSPMVLSN
ncbi:hypothetical protein KIW84_060384 [Lathyrus oleraceus]|uniref:Uncharacterized protein n=1 Tax=Pisum sativum TaxID=3888 RepID=A0A9D4W2V9_PEA|nr:hypothetical protein KIW84_060384 [Pisum sativum]